jgi:hypothetical protein
MKRMFWIGVASIAAALAGCSHMEMGRGSGWETLFDGKNFDAFDKTGDANWRIENGLAVADKGNGFLVSKKEYGDFVIRAEFYAEADTNSGIYFRCSRRSNLDAKVCYEANIWDLRPKNEGGTGAITDLAPVKPTPKEGGMTAANKWNVYEVTAKGDHLVVVLNGVKTSELHDKTLVRGPIALQRFDGNDKVNPIPIKFRKVEIKAL